MGLVLVDTSVWVDFFKGEENPETTILARLLDSGSSICVCPTITQEVLQGISDDKTFEIIREHLSKQLQLVCDPAESAIEAAKIYRLLRKKGITIRKSNDCLIAYHALYYEASILQRDRDYKSIAAHLGLQ